jgi:hypothetical protein
VISNQYAACLEWKPRKTAKNWIKSDLNCSAATYRHNGKGRAGWIGRQVKIRGLCALHVLGFVSFSHILSSVHSLSRVGGTVVSIVDAKSEQ